MRKIKENKALQKAVNWVKNHNRIISISDIDIFEYSPNDYEEIIVGETAGDQYCTDIHFTAMQRVIVCYESNDGKVIEDEILAGFDAMRWTLCGTAAYKGEYLSGDVIRMDFIGEYAHRRPYYE